MVGKKNAAEEGRIEIQQIQMVEIRFNILGNNMIMNRFDRKAQQELLFPSAKRNRAGLEQTLKHDPLAEYRGAMYRCRDPKSPTLIHVPNGSFHGALAQAAIDMPGAKRAQIERLTRVVDLTIHLYGVPQMFMAMVRNSDIARTPDVRTRPIFPEWACKVTCTYVKSILSERTVANLMGAAGVIVGIGDWRGAKGGPFGSFKLVADSDRDFQRVVKEQGRKAQQEAWEDPTYFDEDTEELYTWFQSEVTRREKDLPSARRTVVESGNDARRDNTFVAVE